MSLVKNLQEKFLEDVAAIPDKFPHIKHVTVHAESNIVVVETTYPPPYHVVNISITPQYQEEYPRGEVMFVVGDVLQVISAFEMATMVNVCERVVRACEIMREGPPATHHDGNSMGNAETSSWCRYSSADMATPPTACGAGFQSQLHEGLLRDVQSVSAGRAELVDHPALGCCTISLQVSLASLSEGCAEAWEVLPALPLFVHLTVDRQRYMDAPISVEVGQQRNFTTRSFNGLPGQMKFIVQRFVDAHSKAQSPFLRFIRKGFLVEDVLAAVTAAGYTPATVMEAVMRGENDGAAMSILSKVEVCLLKRNVGEVTKENSQRAFAIVSREYGLLQCLMDYVERRLKTLSSFCAICDRAHDVTSLARLSVCNNTLCNFRFEELDVGKGFGFTVAVESGVVDMLVNFAKTAALSSRWETIFNPFPTLRDAGGNTVASPQKKDATIKLIQEIFIAMPPTYRFLREGSVRQQLAAHHDLAAGLFQWIVSSNTSLLVKLNPQQSYAFMGTPHQFLIAMCSDDRVERFNAKKAAHGSVWAFHGSSGENWHSILRNGLKNASGTKLQVNGAAYGNGIYLSPHSSVSFGYSPVCSTAATAGGNRTASAAADDAARFIDFKSMYCICICEVVDKDIRKSGNIWVHPDEDSVIARYFFVYDSHNQARPSVDLENAATLRVLRERSSELVRR